MFIGHLFSILPLSIHNLKWKLLFSCSKIGTWLSFVENSVNRRRRPKREAWIEPDYRFLQQDMYSKSPVMSSNVSQTKYSYKSCLLFFPRNEKWHHYICDNLSLQSMMYYGCSVCNTSPNKGRKGNLCQMNCCICFTKLTLE